MNKSFQTYSDKANISILIAGRHHVRILKRVGLSLLLLLTIGKGYTAQSTTKPVTAQLASINSEESQMWITIGEHRFAAVLADTEAAREFLAMLPLTLDMADLNGNEKEADLPKALSTDTYQPGTINNGDLMLWGSRTMVVFYKTFNTSYSYTRIGHIEEATDLPQELGRRNVQITFSKE
tara:strand:- start:40204 stop:40743 length:540 start_codon:yes stop_codon:yes gene_type:complete